MGPIVYSPPFTRVGRLNRDSRLVTILHNPQQAGDFMKAPLAAESTEITIFGRIINRAPLSQDMAQHFLSLAFDEEDSQRMEDLLTRNQDGKLTNSEKAELIGFSKAACLLGILHSKARKALKPSKSQTIL